MERDLLKELRKKLKKQMSKSRYEHSLGVEFTGAALAMRYGAEIKKAELAGLLHDCAKLKKISDEDMLHLCHKYKIKTEQAEVEAPYLLHSKLGAYFCQQKYGIKDKEIISAIRFHTTGRPDMTMLEKIIFVADYIEPQRNKAVNLNKIRQIAFQDIDEAVYEITRDTLVYLNSKRSNQGQIDPATYDTYIFYEAIHKQKKEIL